ncbi:MULTISPECIES: ergothioneine biosynthesis protein EgtB [unclassified Streptomyces]|uniref:ergothioneine biosynthesis protein EgtB n=1 Tax=unclassified Streptomyces TaxID=2593676 RepID=UPI00190592B9|nr:MULTISPECIES: ergothioneine biosynthesis protein EgtB [unclassified Streptomyces]MCU4749188.1 ergothioneine biosynthesis protein EgtB [Streptomyces sp. G-5]QQN77269.1 ergothioneine biosynthesis protein EgtB [Streptomyces sp. XC 2026]
MSEYTLPRDRAHDADVLAPQAVLEAARRRTLALTDCLDDDELMAQHSPLMSPLGWDLAHIGNQEEIWLVRRAGGRPALRPDLDDLYDAFRHPRADRPALPLLRPDRARRYLGEVREQALEVLDDATSGRDAGQEQDPLLRRGFVFGMIAQHEQQHDETMLATHQLRSGPPVLDAPPPPPAPSDAATLPAEVLVPGGPFTMGTSTDPWALDNERPAHTVELPPFWLDTVPVTNAAYQRFIEEGGYHDARWWHPDGWEHRRREGLEAPRFWRRDGASGSWYRRRFGRVEPVPPEQPVLHVCWYEADAYARWAGRRLPTEAEWEKAARHDPATGRGTRYPWGDDGPEPGQAGLGQRHLQPAPAGSYPAGAAPSGARQLLGDVWEWTASDFTPYPGFAAFPYREYSEVFFPAPGAASAYKVLRGGSFATDPVACRSTFRNWDHPVRRQIFAGFRTCRDAAPADEGRP